jgi:hypothetical protein
VTSKSYGPTKFEVKFEAFLWIRISTFGDGFESPAKVNGPRAASATPACYWHQLHQHEAVLSSGIPSYTTTTTTSFMHPTGMDMHQQHAAYNWHPRENAME